MTGVVLIRPRPSHTSRDNLWEFPVCNDSYLLSLNQPERGQNTHPA
jgi:hypothetical protein